MKLSELEALAERSEFNFYASQRLSWELFNNRQEIINLVKAAKLMIEHAPNVVVSSGEGTNFYANDVLRQALAAFEEK